MTNLLRDMNDKLITDIDLFNGILSNIIELISKVHIEQRKLNENSCQVSELNNLFQNLNLEFLVDQISQAEKLVDKLKQQDTEIDNAIKSVDVMLTKCTELKNKIDNQKESLQNINLVASALQEEYDMKNIDLEEDQ